MSIVGLGTDHRFLSSLGLRRPWWPSRGPSVGVGAVRLPPDTIGSPRGESMIARAIETLRRGIRMHEISTLAVVIDASGDPRRGRRRTLGAAARVLAAVAREVGTPSQVNAFAIVISHRHEREIVIDRLRDVAVEPAVTGQPLIIPARRLRDRPLRELLAPQPRLST